MLESERVIFFFFSSQCLCETETESSGSLFIMNREDNSSGNLIGLSKFKYKITPTYTRISCASTFHFSGFLRLWRGPVFFNFFVMILRFPFPNIDFTTSTFFFFLVRDREGEENVSINSCCKFFFFLINII